MTELIAPKPAVSAVIVEDGKILLVKRGHEPSSGLWSLPGGRIELGETARDAVVREVAEETGLNIEVDGIAGIRDVIGRGNGEILYHYIIISFFARVLSGDLRAASDAADAEWIPLSQFSDYEMTEGLAEWLAGLNIASAC